MRPWLYENINGKDVVRLSIKRLLGIESNEEVRRVDTEATRTVSH